MSVHKYTRAEVAARDNNKQNLIIIDNVVYDVAAFLEDHPGGTEVLVDNAGSDASECFHEVGHSEIAIEWRNTFKVGEIVDEEKLEVKCKQPSAAESAEPLTLGGLLAVYGPPVAMAVLAYLLYTFLFG
ncbi:cytochrome b5-like [Bombyx mandarina]|uniref:Cytochrome b5 n=2 Tax=Bombyx TaxID=7090 RepID=Q1HQ61_BOMMO|nr:cytochrome b5 [Bombyx mori]XP_028027566.1 cytochrome b5-like [Bombyx mandarina]ABF51280.1 cytochrome b5 [Bombyx mori]